MAENKMAQVAEMFGKRIGEEFRLKAVFGNKLVRFCEKGVEYYSVVMCRWKPSERILIMLLTGEAEIVEDEDNGND